MKHKVLIILMLAAGTANAVNKDEIQKSTITTCSYQAGTAREVQNIRQVEGDDWPQFQQKINRLYKDTPGRRDLLQIGKMVYLQPPQTILDDVYGSAFDKCVERLQGDDLSV